jgi:hypothetical protein
LSALFGGAVLALLLTGCSRRIPSASDALRTPPQTEVRQTAFRGWSDCVQLRNGLVCVTTAPQVGGRTIEYALGPYNFLFIGREEQGATLASLDEGVHPYVGGHFARLHPERTWRELQSRTPTDLSLGKYATRSIEPSEEANGAASVDLASRTDLATGTALRRRIELFPLSTHLRITDTLINMRPVAQQWGIHDILQLKGVARASGVLRGSDQADGNIRLYVPLNPQSAFPGGVQWLVPSDERGTPGARQWDREALPGILTLRYQGEFSRVSVDPALPWIAWADRQEGWVFAQVCSAPRKAIQTAGGTLIPYPFIEVQTLAPIAEIERNQTATLVQDWYACRCPAPVVDVTEVGAVSSPLTLLRDADGTTYAEGTFGLFHVGIATLLCRSAEGEELDARDCGPVGPAEPLRLNQQVRIPDGTAEVVLEVRDADGQALGHLGRILLGSR